MIAWALKLWQILLVIGGIVLMLSIPLLLIITMLKSLSARKKEPGYTRARRRKSTAPTAPPAPTLRDNAEPE